MTKPSNSGARPTANLVQGSADAAVELSEAELAKVSGGDKTKTATTAGNNKSTEYLKITMQDVIISS
jgi:bacteriocin-like protein